MIPVEPISLSFGAIALAALFSTCLECFDYFKAAQSFAEDFELLIVKLDCQKERLLTWGDLVGISKTVEEGRNSYLDTAKGELVKRCLESLESLCSNAEKLQREFGVQATISSHSQGDSSGQLSLNRANGFRKSLQQFFPPRRSQKPHNIVIRTKWAIHDKTKFENLISHIKDLVTELHNIIPVPARAQEKMVHTDIASLGLSRLRLVQTACEGMYQTWSDVAGAIIMASVIGTIDRRSVGEWIQDTKEVENESPGALPSLVSVQKPIKVDREIFDINVSNSTYFYFISTGRCLYNGSESNCHPSTLGSMTFKLRGECFLPGPEVVSLKAWALGQRITKSMDVSFGWDDLEMLRQANYELSDLQNAALHAQLPLGTTYIYCAPCTCSVRMALRVCSEEQSKTLQYMVRVDDRISASCCDETTQLARLVSLVTMVKEIEAMTTSARTGLNTQSTQYMDRVWIEQRIYCLEEELYGQSVERSLFDRGAELLAQIRDEAKRTAIVFLGELDHCVWMMQTPPFPWKARMPKETEIYKLKKVHHAGNWERTFLGTYTPRKFKATTNSHTSTTLLSSPILGSHTGPTLASSESRLSLPNAKRQKFSETSAEDAQNIQNGEAAINTTLPTSSQAPEDEFSFNHSILSESLDQQSFDIDMIKTALSS